VRDAGGQSLRYIQASVSVSFDRVADVRRKASLFEDEFGIHFPERFGPPAVTGIPDEVEPEWPRLVLESKSGFTRVLVSQVGATFATTFSADWLQDRERIRTFVREQAARFFDAVTAVEGVRTRYTGLQTLARVTSNELDANRLTEPSGISISPEGNCTMCLCSGRRSLRAPTSATLPCEPTAFGTASLEPAPRPAAGGARCREGCGASQRFQRSFRLQRATGVRNFRAGDV